MNPDHRKISWLAPVALIALFGAETLLFVRWIPDDAFISFRYAANLADGLGPVFNAGDRVEGVSNPLWTLLLGALTRIGLDTVVLAVSLSLACSLASIALTWKLFEYAVSSCGIDDGERRRFVGLRLVLGFGVAASLPMVFYATSGLETQAELALLLAAVLLHLDARRGHNQRRFFYSQSALLAVALLRPEGVLFLLLGSGFVAAGSGRDGPGWRRTWPAVALPLVALALAVLARYVYYGSLIPNTYLAKPGASPAYTLPLWRGLVYLVRFFLVSGLVLILPFAAIAFGDSRRSYCCVLIASIVAVQLGFIVLVGGDVLRFDRFTVPFLPFLFALALIGFIRLDDLARSRSRKLPIIAAAICVVVIAGLNGGRFYLAHQKFCVHDWMHAQVHRRVGDYLRRVLPAGASVVTNEVGAIAYTSGLEVFDMIGLTDATVGHLLYQSYQRFGVSGSSYSVPRIAVYLMSRSPDCIILPAYGEIDPEDFRPVGDLMHPIWEGLFLHPGLADHYRCAFRLRIHDKKYWYFYFRRNGRHGIAPPFSPETYRCMDVKEFDIRPRAPEE